MQKPITKVLFTQFQGASPARVNRKTGIMQINMPVWQKLSPDARAFVYFHEEGHVALNTTDELEADRYAFEKYAASGKSLRGAVASLTKVLSGNSPEHVVRAKRVLELAMDYDKKNLTNFSGMYDFDYATGKKKARQEKKQSRVERRTERKDLRVQKKADRNDRKNTRVDSKADKRVALADRGVSEAGQIASGVGQGLAGIGQAVAAIAAPGIGAAGATGLGSFADNNAGSFTPQAPAVESMGNFNTMSPAQAAVSGGGGGRFLSAQPDEETNESPASEAQRPMADRYQDPQTKKNKKNYLIAGAILVVIVLVIVIAKRKK